MIIKGKKISNKKYGIILVGRDWKMPFKDIESVVKKIQKDFPKFKMEDRLSGGENDSIYTVLSNYPDILNLTSEIGSDLFIVDSIGDKKGVIWFNSEDELKEMVEDSIKH